LKQKLEAGNRIQELLRGSRESQPRLAALTGSGQLLFDNRKAGKFTPIIPALITVRRNAMVWTITSSARVEQYCGRKQKGSSANCLRTAETKASLGSNSG
jgi:hypothetical protein